MAVPPVCVLVRIPSLMRLKAARFAEGLIFNVQANIPYSVSVFLGHLCTEVLCWYLHARFKMMSSSSGCAKEPSSAHKVLHCSDQGELTAQSKR